MSERCRSRRVAELTGWSIRTVQEKAAAGEVPSAARPDDDSHWTYDEAIIRIWIRSWRGGACRTTSKGGDRAVRGTPASRSEVVGYEEAYEQLLSQRPSVG